MQLSRRRSTQVQSTGISGQTDKYIYLCRVRTIIVLLLLQYGYNEPSSETKGNRVGNTYNRSQLALSAGLL